MLACRLLAFGLILCLLCFVCGLTVVLGLRAFASVWFACLWVVCFAAV